jgi:hypothetical protein
MVTYTYVSQTNLVDRIGGLLCSIVLHLICITGQTTTATLSWFHLELKANSGLVN